jgi:hypothetical protein
MIIPVHGDDDSKEPTDYGHIGRNFLLGLTLTAARAKPRRRAKRPPQFGVGPADSLGILFGRLQI